MGSNNGSGIPMFFACPFKRRAPTWDRSPHDVTLTGKTKPVGKTGGIRNSKLSREYTCSCGHVGWSKHMDLERMEQRQARNVSVKP